MTYKQTSYDINKNKIIKIIEIRVYKYLTKWTKSEQKGVN